MPIATRQNHSLLRRIPAGWWVLANGHDRQALRAAVEAGLLLTCRRYYQHRPGRPATLYKLSTMGEIMVHGSDFGARWV